MLIFFLLSFALSVHNFTLMYRDSLRTQLATSILEGKKILHWSDGKKLWLGIDMYIKKIDKMKTAIFRYWFIYDFNFLMFSCKGVMGILYNSIRKCNVIPFCKGALQRTPFIFLFFLSFFILPLSFFLLVIFSFNVSFVANGV